MLSRTAITILVGNTNSTHINSMKERFQADPRKLSRLVAPLLTLGLFAPSLVPMQETNPEIAPVAPVVSEYVESDAMEDVMESAAPAALQAALDEPTELYDWDFGKPTIGQVCEANADELSMGNYYDSDVAYADFARSMIAATTHEEVAHFADEFFTSINMPFGIYTNSTTINNATGGFDAEQVAGFGITPYDPEDQNLGSFREVMLGLAANHARGSGQLSELSGQVIIAGGKIGDDTVLGQFRAGAVGPDDNVTVYLANAISNRNKAISVVGHEANHALETYITEVTGADYTLGLPNGFLYRADSALSVEQYDKTYGGLASPGPGKVFVRSYSMASSREDWGTMGELHAPGRVRPNLDLITPPYFENRSSLFALREVDMLRCKNVIAPGATVDFIMSLGEDPATTAALINFYTASLPTQHAGIRLAACVHEFPETPEICTPTP